MKTCTISFISALLVFTQCQSDYFTSNDYQSVLKIDSHVHINSDKGFFEDQAIKDNFLLITLNVDHSDSANIRKQFDYAVSTVKKHPGRVFYGPTFLFDTVAWGTDAWSTKVITQLEQEY